jgi:hypothetical protein
MGTTQHGTEGALVGGWRWTMWIITNFGFFSIVEKPHDRVSQTVTIRSRVKKDLQNLQERYLPQMGPIQEGVGTDYRYRTTTSKSEFANALLQIGLNIDYDNFKDSVFENQGRKRQTLYHRVWTVLDELQQSSLKEEEQP